MSLTGRKYPDRRSVMARVVRIVDDADQWMTADGIHAALVEELPQATKALVCVTLSRLLDRGAIAGCRVYIDEVPLLRPMIYGRRGLALTGTATERLFRLERV